MIFHDFLYWKMIHILCIIDDYTFRSLLWHDCDESRQEKVVVVPFQTAHEPGCCRILRSLTKMLFVRHALQ